MSANQDPYSGEIAIIGMSARVPGAANLAAFWENLCNGVDSISSFTDEELLASGVSPAHFQKSNYIRARGIIEDISLFDAAFFGVRPSEAKVLDPQHRFYLEEVWHALEHAGYDPQRIDFPVGVFAGAAPNRYLRRNLETNDLKIATPFEMGILNNREFLPTYVSYKLNLKGPSVNLQTACSTSLVATHLACQSLLTGECDMALAGGVALRVPHKVGYMHQPGMIYSADGKVRAFDAKGTGFVFGQGAAVVVLKRMAEAVQDGDCIHAVIRGSGINNDGGAKVGFAAPSVEGQAELISETLDVAGVHPEEVGMIEAHGTATQLGDPIEIAALSQAYGAMTERKGYCAVGSVKTNIGHLASAAGAAGLIKAALAVKHGLIPPSLHIDEVNPVLDMENTPFFVVDRALPWAAEGPRIAGVNSFGVGGTNAHALVAQAPDVKETAVGAAFRILPLAARSERALKQRCQDLADFLEKGGDLDLDDVAHTLQVGRSLFTHRTAVVCQNAADAVAQLRRSGPVLEAAAQKPRTVWLLPGQGSQYPGMCRDLYHSYPVFREAHDRCTGHLANVHGLNLSALLLEATNDEAAVRHLARTENAQPALFVAGYATGCLWCSWGLEPDALLGHSLGEITAACLAGVMALEDALDMVVHRGRAMQACPGGRMLSASLTRIEAQAWLRDGLVIAVVNGPKSCVFSGETAAIERLADDLQEKGVRAKLLDTSHGFHSPAMSPAVVPFGETMRGVRLHPPKQRLISNLSGDWLADEEAVDPDYWVRQMRQPMQFHDGLKRLLADHTVFLEVGPGRALASLVGYAAGEREISVVTTLPKRGTWDDGRSAAEALAQLWCLGLSPDWRAFDQHRRRYRTPVPVYPFERERFWIEPGTTGAEGPGQAVADPRDWVWTPGWRSAVLGKTTPTGAILVFEDQAGFAAGLAARWHEDQPIIRVRSGASFAGRGDGPYVIDGANAADYGHLIDGLVEAGRSVDYVLDARNLTLGIGGEEPAARRIAELTNLAQALSQWEDLPESVPILTLVNGLADVSGDEDLDPNKAPLAGAGQMARRYWDKVFLLDVSWPGKKGTEDAVLNAALSYLASPVAPLAALRGRRLWTPCAERLNSSLKVDDSGRRLLMLGGEGAFGQMLSRHLSGALNVELVHHKGDDPKPVEPARFSVSFGEHGAAIEGFVRHHHEAMKLGDHLDEPPFHRDANRFAVLLVHRFFERQGYWRAVGDHADFETVNAGLKVLPVYRNFVTFLIAVMESGQRIQRRGDVWVCLEDAPSEESVQHDLETGAAAYQVLAPIFSCLAFAVDHYPSLLNGDLHALHFFDKHETKPWSRAVANLDGVKYHGFYGRMLADMVAELVLPRCKGTLRILEVGAGKGILTRCFYEMLAQADVHYQVTDISNFFVKRQKEKAAELGLDNMSFSRFDISKDPLTQGYGAGSYDMILGLNVIHATPRVRETLHHLRTLLAPGGNLAIIEEGAMPDWMQMWYGLYEGWWLYEDFDLRSHGPLMPVNQWKGVLADLGMENLAVFPPQSYRGYATGFLITGNTTAGMPDSKSVGEAKVDSGRKDQPVDQAVVVLADLGGIDGEMDATAIAASIEQQVAGISAPEKEARSRGASQMTVVLASGGPVAEAVAAVVQQKALRADNTFAMRLLIWDPDVGQALAGFQDEVTSQLLTRAWCADAPVCMVSAGDPFAIPETTPDHKADEVRQESSGDQGLEETVISLWCDYLGLDEARDEDDFFEVGGDSLVAIRLIAVLNKTLDIQLSPNALIGASTFGDLLSLVHQCLVPSDGAVYEPALLCLKDGDGDKTPLLMVPPGEVDIYAFRELTRWMERGEIFSLRDGLSWRRHCGGVVAMASAYLEAVQPSFQGRDLVLGGFSYGGMVAFEMACQLQSEGMAPSSLVLFESPAPQLIDPIFLTPHGLAAFIQAQFDPTKKVQALIDELEGIETKDIYALFAAHPAIKNSWLGGLGKEHLENYLETFAWNINAMRQYRGGTFHGQATLVIPQQPLSKSLDKLESYWRERCPSGLEIRRVPGNHFTMWAPAHVRAIADLLEEVGTTKASI